VLRAWAGLGFFSSLRIWCTAKAEVRLVARLQRILFWAIMRQDVEYFDGKSAIQVLKHQDHLDGQGHTCLSPSAHAFSGTPSAARVHRPSVLTTCFALACTNRADTGTGALTSRLTSDATLLGSILTTNCNVRRHACHWVLPTG
jgi:ABC-type multidrug transport system fused ATPase/permease subunit